MDSSLLTPLDALSTMDIKRGLGLNKDQVSTLMYYDAIHASKEKTTINGTYVRCAMSKETERDGQWRMK